MLRGTRQEARTHALEEVVALAFDAIRAVSAERQVATARPLAALRDDP